MVRRIEKNYLIHKNILITGGLGFIGSNFIKYLRKKTNANIINIDKVTHNFFLINSFKLNRLKNYFFYNLDITNKKKIKEIFEFHKIDLVFNFAAESHVDNSILKPERFIKTNILGTSILLELSYSFWKLYDNLDKNIFVQISTDEVYGSISVKSKRKFRENDKFYPNSPYSASKASADLIVRSFNKTYGLNTITTNSSNNFGPGQMTEKLIPKAIFNLLNNQKIPIYGKGNNIRDWIFVEDNVQAIFLLYKFGKFGSSYNIGGNNCLSNNELITCIIKSFNNDFKKKYKFSEVTEYVEDRLGHDFKYDVDTSNIEDLGIFIKKDLFIRNLSFTINWYVKNKNEIKKFM